MNHVYKPYINKLRRIGLKPTKQRLIICRILFNRSKTFHFTISSIKKIIDKKTKNKISQATIYNTVHAFKNNGYLKEMSLTNNKKFYDTNTSNHHHFYDEDSSQLIDIEKNKMSLVNIPEIPAGKKIKDVEITIKVASNYQKKKNN